MEIDKVLQRYKENYCRIFEKIYPSHGGTGFTERNLSVNFAKAYESVYPDAITWYEFQFGKRNSQHYDAIIVDPENKKLIVIESKRFTNTEKKIESVGNDIERIREFEEATYLYEFNKRIPDLQDYSVVGVILADVWTEGSEKPKIKQSFENETFLQDYRENLSLGEHPDSWFLEGQYFCKGFSDINTPNLERGNTIPTNYYLVGMIWNVT